MLPEGTDVHPELQETRERARSLEGETFSLPVELLSNTTDEMNSCGPMCLIDLSVLFYCFKADGKLLLNRIWLPQRESDQLMV